MTALYFLVALMGAGLFLFSDEIVDPDVDEMELKIMGCVYGVVGLGLAVLFLVGAFVPRRPWGWIYSVILIGLGLTSCCLLPATIPLLIYWIKPEVKQYYNFG